jgi:predicted transcriptional regulator YheO
MSFALEICSGAVVSGELGAKFGVLVHLRLKCAKKESRPISGNMDAKLRGKSARLRFPTAALKCAKTDVLCMLCINYESDKMFTCYMITYR